MPTDIEFLLDDKITEKVELDYDNLPATIFDFTIDIDTRITALEAYYDEKKEETIEIVRRINGMYQISGISILEKFLLKISKSLKLSVLIRLEAVKSLLMYKELEDDIEEDDSLSEKEEKENDNELVRSRNEKRFESSSFALKEICSTSEELPTPCRIEAIHLLMDFQNYEEESKTYFNTLVNDQNIECEFRYSTILFLEKKSSEYMKNKLLSLFDNKEFVKDLFVECSEVISKEFPNFIPNLQNEVFFHLLIARLNFDLTRKLFDKYLCMTDRFQYFLFHAQLAFLFNESNMTYYKILSGQYLLQKFSQQIKEQNVETCLLSFAEDNDLDYDRRADAADVLLQLGTPEMKQRCREIIMTLGAVKGHVRTVFDNAQNVHTEEVEASVSEALEFFSMMPLHMVNKNVIEYDYVKEQVERMLKDERESKIVSLGNEKCLYNSEGCGIDKYYCCENCMKIGEKERKIEIALNRINMDRALYSKYNSSLSNILIKVWSYLAGHEHEQEMRKRLLEELEEMSGTCSSGFASRLINVISGFGQFNIRISWEDQIIANFGGRLNAVARKITKQGNIFYTEKTEDIVKLWLNNSEQKDLKERLIEELKKTEYITDNPTMSDIVKHYLLKDKEEKIADCVEYFAENVLNEMTLSSSNTSKRLHFSLFFRTYVAYIREEMYQEFKDHLDDTSFDLYMRKAIMRYESF
jgi:hypothetical protein